MQSIERFGRYDLVQRIACGGTAEVFRAILQSEHGFKKTLAVKRLLPSLCLDESMSKMLIDEARILVNLQHPNIVQVFDLGIQDGIPFIAMELVDGITLARLLNHLIKERAGLPHPIALFIIEQLLSAIEFAHRARGTDGKTLKIVHRDISPANILISWNGEVKLTDFGIAKWERAEQVTAIGQLKGKCAYMAPEQAMGMAVDTRADLFSTGVVLFEIILGARLFSAENDLEMIERVRRCEIQFDRLKGIAPEIRSILMMSLAKKPSDRYQLAIEMLEDLRMTMAGLDIRSLHYELSRYILNAFPKNIESQSKPLTAITQKTKRIDVGAQAVAENRIGIVSFARISAMLLFILMISPGGAISNRGANNTAQEISPLPKIIVNAEPLIRAQKKDPPPMLDELDIETKTVEKKVSPTKDPQPSYISIQAIPWGLASIDGVINNRETPINRVKLKSGRYDLIVRYPPTDAIARASINFQDGGSKRCTAKFEEGTPSLRCK